LQDRKPWLGGRDNDRTGLLGALLTAQLERTDSAGVGRRVRNQPRDRLCVQWVCTGLRSPLLSVHAPRRRPLSTRSSIATSPREAATRRSPRSNRSSFAANTAKANPFRRTPVLR